METLSIMSADPVVVRLAQPQNWILLWSVLLSAWRSANALQILHTSTQPPTRVMRLTILATVTTLAVPHPLMTAPACEELWGLVKRSHERLAGLLTYLLLNNRLKQLS